MHCREILFTPRSSPRPRSFPGLDNVFVRRTVAELQGVKVAKFSDFGLFSHTKPLKRTFRWPAYTAQKLHCRMITIFLCGIRRSKGVHSGWDVFLRLLVEELGPPNLPKFSPVVNGYIHAESCHYTARQIWTNDVWKRAILRTDVLSHQISSPLPPKSPPKPHFERPFNAKPIIHGAVCMSHVNAARKLKLYSYIGTGKYLGLGEWVCQNFSARARTGGAGPFNANLGPPYYLGNY